MYHHFTGKLAINGKVNDLAMIETVPQLSANQQSMDGQKMCEDVTTEDALPNSPGAPDSISIEMNGRARNCRLICENGTRLSRK